MLADTMCRERDILFLQIKILSKESICPRQRERSTCSRECGGGEPLPAPARKEQMHALCVLNHPPLAPVLLLFSPPLLVPSPPPPSSSASFLLLFLLFLFPPLPPLPLSSSSSVLVRESQAPKQHVRAKHYKLRRVRWCERQSAVLRQHARACAHAVGRGSKHNNGSCNVSRPDAESTAMPLEQSPPPRRVSRAQSKCAGALAASQHSPLSPRVRNMTEARRTRVRRKRPRHFARTWFSRKPAHKHHSPGAQQQWLHLRTCERCTRQ